MKILEIGGTNLLPYRRALTWQRLDTSVNETHIAAGQ